MSHRRQSHVAQIHVNVPKLMSILRQIYGMKVMDLMRSRHQILQLTHYNLIGLTKDLSKQLGSSEQHWCMLCFLIAISAWNVCVGGGGIALWPQSEHGSKPETHLRCYVSRHLPNVLDFIGQFFVTVWIFMP